MFGALDKEKGQVVNALLKNGYLKTFIHQSTSTTHTTIMEKPKATVCLPYTKGISEPLKRGLQSRTVLRPHRMLKQSLVHPKDAIPDMKKSNVVYCIP